MRSPSGSPGLKSTDGGADYVLAVKENQGQLYESIQDLFEGAEALGFDETPYDHAQTVDKGHGRVERRECWVITEPDCLDYLDPQEQWPQLKAAIRVVGPPHHRSGRRQPTPLLHQQPGRLRRTTAGRHQEPLEHRKLVALDLGRGPFGKISAECARTMAHRT